PLRVHGLDVPAQLRAVDYVVVDQRRGVDELERLGEVEHDLAVPSGTEPRREEDERGAEELPRRGEEMSNGFTKHRMCSAAHVAKPTLELAQLPIYRRIKGRARRRPHDAESRDEFAPCCLRLSRRCRSRWL